MPEIDVGYSIRLHVSINQAGRDIGVEQQTLPSPSRHTLQVCGQERNLPPPTKPGSMP